MRTPTKGSKAEKKGARKSKKSASRGMSGANTEARRRPDTAGSAAAAQPDVAEIDLTAAKALDSAAGSDLVASFTVPPAVELVGLDVSVLTPATPTDVPGSPPEPVYPVGVQDDIQGNVLPGFNKPHQCFLFYRICDVRAARAFLKWLAPRITSMEEVIAFRRLFRARKLKLGRGNIDLCSTWVNIGFSHRAIARLESKADANAFGDRSFRGGLAARSAYLGDPTSSRSHGHPSRWCVGGPENEAEIVIIVASDMPSMLEVRVKEIAIQAQRRQLELIFQQRGDVLPGDLHGHEHFGFLDGISQPGVRGKLSTAPGDYITPRYIDATDPRRLYFAKPGQLLLWPGQILLGEERQSTEDHINSVPGSSNFPSWARRGSYLVVRRLHQDVSAFWTFVRAAAVKLGMDSTKFASLLVGRWPSGAPLMRAPGADDPALGGDEFANNHFIFDDDTRPSDLRPIPGYPGDTYPPAAADFLAKVCPHFAHIRKVNPRDSATEMGKPEDSIVHMILRRGIPYGPPLLGVKRPSKKLVRAERGLMFLSYGATIEGQFEFLQRRWSNSPAQPNLGGHDPIIGQNGTSGGRVRFIDVPMPSGPARLKVKSEWVIPTGGGYFFSPTISAVRNVLAS